MIYGTGYYIRGILSATQRHPEGDARVKLSHLTEQTPNQDLTMMSSCNTSTMLTLLAVLSVAQHASAFSIVPVTSRNVFASTGPLFSYYPEEGEQQPVWDQESINQEMGSMQSRYPTSEADYLAAARQRAAEGRASMDSQSTDDDWQRMAWEKKQELGELDDWEESVKEAGNEDSQILLFPEMMQGEGEGGPEEGGDPQLIL